MTPLVGHNSPETAYEVSDYPYGFRLRCKIRYWIETSKKKGQRFVSQTTNPKIDTSSTGGRDVWNKPKASTYSIIKVMYLDDSDHVHADGVGAYSVSELEDFISRWGGEGSEVFADEYRQYAIKGLRKAVERMSKMTWTVTSSTYVPKVEKE